MSSGSKAQRVKNRAPAPIQTTTEQILRDAVERTATEGREIKQRIMDPEELDDYRMNKRKEFEDRIRIARDHIGTWIKYAVWEESQQCLERARSIYERVLDIDYREPALWRRYAEMEMRFKNVNRARNIFDRAVELLPRVDQLWYKYAYMEEMVGDVGKARNVFNRWMKWEPGRDAWSSFAKMETRAGSIARARDVYERYIATHPVQASYLQYAKWEARQLQRALARTVFERALEELPAEEQDEALFLDFADFEERCKEMERARAIYKYGLEALPRADSGRLRTAYVAFEKRHGSKEEVEGVILDRRRAQYEEAVLEDPGNYDVWFDFARLEESGGDATRVRDVYERAVANVPAGTEKKFWKRYIFLWVFYALYEELVANDPARTRAVYKTALKVVPHKQFTFAKLWVMYAHFEVRQRDLVAARKALGNAIGLCPKRKLFEAYIGLELQLGEIDRCRSVYAKFLEFAPHDGAVWTKFAKLEESVGETERARAVYELAINQPALDGPEALWKAFIDFEMGAGENENARALYERLLERSQHFKVFLSFAKFEASIGETDRARAVFQRAEDCMKAAEAKDERRLVVEAWHGMEEAQGKANAARAEEVRARLPRRVTKRRMVAGGDGDVPQYEEFEDLVFPEEETASKAMSFLQAAHAWRRKRAAEEMEAGGEDAAEGEGPPAAKAAFGASRTGESAAAEGGDGADDDAEIDLDM